MTNDTTTLTGALIELGETMADNLNTMGVNASASDGLTTLANKIVDIKPTLKSNKDFIQVGEEINLSLDVEFYQYNPLLFYYEGLGGFEVDSWIVGVTTTVVSDNTGTTITGATGSAYLWANLSGTSASANVGDYFGDLSIEFDVVSRTNNSWIWLAEDTRVSSPVNKNIRLNTGHNKIVRTGDLIEYYVDDELVSSETVKLRDMIRIGFVCSQGHNIKIKNFIIGGY
jgi:hypothetical protein